MGLHQKLYFCDALIGPMDIRRLMGKGLDEIMLGLDLIHLLYYGSCEATTILFHTNQNQSYKTELKA